MSGKWEGLEFFLGLLAGIMFGAFVGVLWGASSVRVESRWPVLCQTATATAKLTPRIPR